MCCLNFAFILETELFDGNWLELGEELGFPLGTVLITTLGLILEELVILGARFEF